MPGYGLTFWLNVAIPAEKLATAHLPDRAVSPTEGRFYLPAGADMVVAAGARVQRLFVIPSRRTIVVRQGHGDLFWSDSAFLARALDGIAR